MSNKYICIYEGCSKEYKKIDRFKSHLLFHTGERPYICSYENCDKKYRMKSDLELHIKIHTGENLFKCTYEGCNKVFTKNSSLINHILVHTKENLVKCNYENCEKAFKNNYELKKHLNIHKNITYKCDFKGCNIVLVTKEGLEKHKQLHIKTKIHICEICEYKTIKIAEFKRHIRVHTNERPFKCTVENCNYSSKLKNGLDNHIKIHNNERAFKCSYENCEMSFIQSSNLKRHVKTHTGDCPYKCTYENCNMSFKQDIHLKTHSLKHKGERPFNCIFEDCCFRAITKSNLNSHIKRWHSHIKIERKKITESNTYNLLSKHFNLIREYHINLKFKNKTYCKIDLVYNTNKALFYIENDEYQHKSNTVYHELQRMTDVKDYLIFNNIKTPLIWIRYNPNSFKINGRITSLKEEDKIIKVSNLIKNILENKDYLKPMSIYYCYYDIKNNKLEVLDDPDYNQELKEIVYNLN